MKKKNIESIWKHFICIVLSLIVIAPFYLVFINSFKTKAEAARMSLSLPTKWVFTNFGEVIEKGKLLQGFVNSLLYATVATTVGVVLCAMAAFVMSRKRTKINNFLYYFIFNFFFHL